MTNRTVLGPLPGGGIGLRVSRPGFNVLDAGLTGQQLAFDSNWLNTSIVFMQGTIFLPMDTGLNTVFFGTTFAFAPPVIAYYDDAGTLTPIVGANRGEISGWLPDGDVGEPFLVYTDRVQFRASGLSDRLVRYIIMRSL